MNPFKPELIDALTKLIGMGVGKAADVLNSMLDSHIGLSVPSVRLAQGAEMIDVLSPDGGTPFPPCRCVIPEA